MDLQAKAKEVQEKGYCLFPGIYSNDEINEMRRLLDAHWEKIGHPSMAGFGVGIHPLFPQIPELAPFLAKKEVIQTADLVVGGRARLCHAGARLSNLESAPQIGWHHHYGNWDASLIPRRARCERVLTAIYVDGSNAAAGPLIVLPRRCDDPLESPRGDVHGQWPGQVVIEAPPGSGAIFDTAVWHTASRGSANAIRHIFGTHVQSWDDPRAHVEDNAVDVPEVRGLVESNQVLRRLLRR